MPPEELDEVAKAKRQRRNTQRKQSRDRCKARAEKHLDAVEQALRESRERVEELENNQRTCNAVASANSKKQAEKIQKLEREVSNRPVMSRSAPPILRILS